jgi:hypothetical protein
MKLRKEYIILGILIVALSVYVFFRESDHSLYKLPVLSPIEAADITRIEIDTPEASISLYRKNGNWVVGEKAYPADEAKVRQITGVIGKLTLTTLVSDSKNYERYELGKDNKIVVKAWSNDKLVRSFDVGKSPASLGHTFVKIADDHRVYHGRQSFRQHMQTTLDDLRDNRVLSFDQSQINRIQLEKDKTPFLYIKETPPVSDGQDTVNQTGADISMEPVWKNQEGKTVQDKALKKLLKDLEQLKCEQFIYDRPKMVFKDPVYTLTLEGTETYSLSIFKQQSKGASEYPVISSHNDYPFLLPKWQVDRIMLDPEDIDHRL